jgi:hypothetical protein
MQSISGIFKLLRSTGIDSKVLTPPAYVACPEILNNLWGLGIEKE